MAELQGLQLRHDDFAGRGAEILAVVVDPVQKNAEVVRELGLSYRIVADPEMKVIDVYGLRHSGGHEGEDIARPATFLIDEKGVVVWRNLAENIRKRPHPEEILAEIDRMRG
jgi:peroxiredoxin Q/BCP